MSINTSCDGRQSVGVTWIAGDTENFVINRLDPDRVPIDMTGMTTKMSLRRKYTDLDSVLDINGDITIDEGKITFTASSADTRLIANNRRITNYVFDCQVSDGVNITTLVGGTITVRLDVTR